MVNVWFETPDAKEALFLAGVDRATGDRIAYALIEEGFTKVAWTVAE